MKNLLPLIAATFVFNTYAQVPIRTSTNEVGFSNKPHVVKPQSCGRSGSVQERIKDCERVTGFKNKSKSIVLVERDATHLKNGKNSVTSIFYDRHFNIIWGDLEETSVRFTSARSICSRKKSIIEDNVKWRLPTHEEMAYENENLNDYNDNELKERLWSELPNTNHLFWTTTPLRHSTMEKTVYNPFKDMTSFRMANAFDELGFASVRCVGEIK